MSNHIFETGAKTAAANNLVLCVLNNGEIYKNRLQCGYAMLSGGKYHLSFRDLAESAAKVERLSGCKFKAADITDAGRIIQKQTIEHCIELTVDGYNPKRNINIIGRKWWDGVNGNTYFSVCVYIPIGADSYCQINIPFQYGYGDQWKYETAEMLKRIGILDANEKKPAYELPINFEFQGNMKKNQMFTGIYI